MEINSRHESWDDDEDKKKEEKLKEKRQAAANEIKYASAEKNCAIIIRIYAINGRGSSRNSCHVPTTGFYRQRNFTL